MLELRNAGKRFEADGQPVDALAEVNLTIHRGDYVAIMGRSGSGKSTLLSILGCIERLTAGTYTLDGADVSLSAESRLSELRARTFGFVFQSFHLLPELTALENVMLPLRYGQLPKVHWQERALQLLADVGLESRARHKPRQLSGGEQQRVAIARALVNDPAVILADEPTGNLDSRSRDEIVELLEVQVAGDRTLVLVTHDEQLAARAGERHELVDGRISAERASTISNPT